MVITPWSENLWRDFWSGWETTTSVERPECMSWAPSEAKPTVSTVLVGGEISSPLLGTEGPSWRGAPEEARREGILNLGTIFCPGLFSTMRSGRTRSWQTLSRTPGSRAIGGNVYRQSLGHVCTIASGQRGAGCVSKNQSGEWDVSRDANRSTRAPSAYQLHTWASIPKASAPVSTGCLLLYCGPSGCKLLEETKTSLGCTGGFGTPVCKVDVTANPPGDLSRRPPMCCLRGQAHGGPWDLLGSSWKQEIKPTSPDGWCAMRDAWPSLILFTADRMDSIRAGDRCACINVESHTTPRKVVLCSGERCFLVFSRNTQIFHVGQI